METKNEKPKTFELAKDFVTATSFEGLPTIWYWREGWHVWSGHSYNRVCQQDVERRILRFLEDRSDTTVSGAAIRGIVELLRIMQFCSEAVTPCWRNEKNSLAPNEVFCVRNGMLHIPSTELLPHTPAFFSLTAAEFEYCRSASCRRWIEFLGELWPNQTGTINMLQEWFGYCLLPDTSQQKILAVVGPPRSGKSTIARVLRELLGRQNVACPSIRSLSGQFGLWALLDKSLAIVP